MLEQLDISAANRRLIKSTRANSAKSGLYRRAIRHRRIRVRVVPSAKSKERWPEDPDRSTEVPARYNPDSRRARKSVSPWVGRRQEYPGCPSPTSCDEFAETGTVRLDAAFPSTGAEQMTNAVWAYAEAQGWHPPGRPRLLA